MLREHFSTEIFTILIIVSLILTATAKLLYPKRFQEFISILINFRYLRIYSREQKFFDGFEAILFSNLVIGLAVFTFIFYNNGFQNESVPQSSLFKIGFAIGVFMLIKVLIERLISSVLNLDFIINDYLFEKINYKNFLGLILIPVNALLIYRFEPNENTLLVIVSILLTINSIGLIFFFKKHQNTIKKNFFYFILYLCALEISPYLVLYKLIQNA